MYMYVYIDSEPMKNVSGLKTYWAFADIVDFLIYLKWKILLYIKFVNNYILIFYTSSW